MRMRISIGNGPKCIKEDTVASPRVPEERISSTRAARAFAIAARRSRIPRRMAPGNVGYSREISLGRFRCTCLINRFVLIGKGAGEVRVLDGAREELMGEEGVPGRGDRQGFVSLP